MKYYSFTTIVKSLPKKKNSRSSLWVKLIVRRLSFIFTWLFINVGCSAWFASVISVFVAIAGSALLCIDDNLCRVLGVLLVEFWLVMDCVDGNIARVKKTSSLFGEFIDALSGYFITGLIFISVGVSSYFTNSIILIPSYVYIILGGFSSIMGLLTRIIHQKYTYTHLMVYGLVDNRRENEINGKNTIQYLRSRIDKELGISGLFMPFLIVASIFNLYDILTIAYAIFHLMGLSAATIYYSLKAKK